jgi:hypothetical protein
MSCWSLLTRLEAAQTEITMGPVPADEQIKLERGFHHQSCIYCIREPDPCKKSQMKRALLQMMWAEKAQTKMLSGCFGDLTVAQHR